MGRENRMSERDELEQAIAALEGQRAILGDSVVNLAVTPLRQQLAALLTRADRGAAQTGDGAVRRPWSGS
jgi:hypothetical protein